MREFPTVVHVAPGLFEDAAITLKGSAEFGFGAFGGGAVLVAEESLEQLSVDGEGGAFFLEDVHVIVGEDDAGGDLFVGAGVV